MPNQAQLTKTAILFFLSSQLLIIRFWVGCVKSKQKLVYNRLLIIPNVGNFVNSIPSQFERIRTNMSEFLQLENLTLKYSLSWDHDWF